MSRRFISLLTSTALAVSFGASGAALGQDAPDPYLLMPGSIGPVTVGMKTADAVKALGAGWSYQGMTEENDQSCGHIVRDGAWGFMEPMFMAQDGVVTRIEITSSSVTTEKNIHVGSTEKDVLAAYGKDVRSEPHNYAPPPAKYLTVWFQNAPKPGSFDEDKTARGLQFVTDEKGVVVTITAGDTSILYVEGCA